MHTKTYAVVKRGRGLLLDIGAPLALFYGLHMVGASDTSALVISMIPPLASTVYGIARERKADAFGLLVLAAMVLSLAASLIAGSPRELLVRNALITAPLGIWVLLTARRGTPMSYEVTRTLLPGRAALMDRLWSQRPRFRRAWRQITAMWGILGLVDAGLRIYFAATLSIAAVPAIDMVVTIVTVIALQVPTHLFILRSGCWLILFDRRGRAAYEASERSEGSADPEKSESATERTVSAATR